MPGVGGRFARVGGFSPTYSLHVKSCSGGLGLGLKNLVLFTSLPKHVTDQQGLQKFVPYIAWSHVGYEPNSSNLLM